MSDNKNMLLLESAKSLKVEGAGDINRWCKATNDSVALFIKGITTAEGNTGLSTDQLRAMISGIPSPWARVLMTKKALAENPSNLGDTVLDMCYKMFRSEWRGMVAAYALRPDSFEFSAPIPLLGRKISENAGEMSVLNMYGEMLFDETPIWALKNEKVTKQNLRSNPPCLQILYYKIKTDVGFNRIAVGATSPYTLLFSSINYRLPESQETEIPWIVGGKFVDPTDLSPDKFKVEDAQRLHSFIHNMASRMQNGDESSDLDPSKYYLDYFVKFFEAGYASEDYNIGADFMKKAILNWNAELTRWKSELELRISREGRAVNTNIPVAVAMPEGPLAMLMSNERTFWYHSNKVYSSAKEGPCIKSSEIFMDSEYIAAWRGGDKDLSKSAAYYIKVNGGDTGFWLPLPFTKKAMDIFANNLAEMISGNGPVAISAIIGEDGKVQVDFKAKIDDSGDAMSICRKTYQMEIVPEADGKVFTWPDFKSATWNKYFYYSEFPMNVTGVRMIPNFEGVDPSEVEGMRIVTYPVNRVGSSMHKYEIIASQTPLSSIDIHLNKEGRDVVAGTLMLKVQTDSAAFDDTQYMRHYINLNLNPATVGIDFGSTNTCAYYRSEDGRVAAVPFKNRRLAIVGFDNPTLSLAHKDELLFISNEGTIAENGQVKSWLHEHDTMYVTKDGSVEAENSLDTEVIGGVPVNERNIPIVSMDEHIITTNAGRLNYNMKWVSSEETKQRKSAFMKTIWLQICADLVECGLRPQKLHWSYPSSMGKPKELEKIYRELEYPYESAGMPSCSSHTEAESVCAYSMYKGSKVNDSTLSLGVDVGGSTSDILIVRASGATDSLITQSSIRLAGGFFFKAINSSAKFRRAIYNFHESKRTAVKVLNIDDVIRTEEQIYKRSPYYLNNIFDQLFNENDFRKFYGYLQDSVSPVFALPAYVTGILMFYSGMLVRNAIDKNGLDTIKNVAMRYYGKGGRLFEWLLKTQWDDAVNYYKQCFAAGAGTDELKLNILNYSNDTGETIDIKENKSEVAIGLVSGMFDQIEGVSAGEANRVFDVIGEKGFEYFKAGEELRVLGDLDTISDDIFKGGVNLKFPEKMERFSSFLDIFIKFVEIDSGGILKNIKALRDGIEDLNLRSFIQNDPVYQDYLREKDSTSASYKMPIIIAEALSYLNDTLIPTVAKELQ